MRVTSGELRGRRIHTVHGLHVRPTSDKVKQAIFNIIQFDIEGKRALDLFAGTGQLGIEAISRGARSCTFVERGREVVKILKKNVEEMGIKNAQILEQDCFIFLKSKGREQFDIVLADPPYSKDNIDLTLQGLVDGGFLANGAIVVVESDKGEDSIDEYRGLALVKEYRHGRTVIKLYRYNV